MRIVLILLTLSLCLAGLAQADTSIVGYVDRIFTRDKPASIGKIVEHLIVVRSDEKVFYLHWDQLIKSDFGLRKMPPTPSPPPIEQELEFQYFKDSLGELRLKSWRAVK